METFHPIVWSGDAKSGHLKLLDQTRLPEEEVYLECRDVESVWHAIKRLSVRGAPAIGISAAYACVISAQSGGGEAALDFAAEYLATSRPTAVNLFWALGRMRGVRPADPDTLLAEAKKIHEEDKAMCLKIGVHGLGILKKLAEGSTERFGILTHCNAGALATGGIGTATAPIYMAHEEGVAIKVFADETRPLLQGARLTAFELFRAGVDVRIIADNMAGLVMREGKVGMVIVGADRIAHNGDTANKVGTYSVAVLAKHHGVPFYVAAPTSTFDLAIKDGSEIPIEQRASEEITHGFGRRTAPEGALVYNPAFDVTPAELITGIITDRGVISPVNAFNVDRAMRGE
jgi:methylthioribose-1-phosphate isomerase